MHQNLRYIKVLLYILFPHISQYVRVFLFCLLLFWFIRKRLQLWLFILMSISFLKEGTSQLWTRRDWHNRGRPPPPHARCPRAASATYLAFCQQKQWRHRDTHDEAMKSVGVNDWYRWRMKAGNVRRWFFPSSLRLHLAFRNYRQVRLIVFHIAQSNSIQ